MTDSTNQLLSAFDALNPGERHEVFVALLRRVLNEASPEATDDDLVGAAEELFLQLDAAEDSDGGA